jgi:hypothetical protein
MDKDTEKKLDAIFAAIKDLDARVTKIESGASVAGSANSDGQPKSGKKASIREFLIANPPPDSIKRTLAVGYFLEHDAGMSSFTREDLLNGYAEAKEPEPSNITVNISHSIKAGHMMEAREKKDNKTAYVTTSSGEKFVAGGYSKAAAKKK